MASAGSTRCAFDEAAFGLLAEGVFHVDAAGRVLRMNRAADPMLPAYSPTTPNFVPMAGSPAASGAATPPTDGFFEPVTYVGAVEPGSQTNWLTGWTDYPAN